MTMPPTAKQRAALDYIRTHPTTTSAAIARAAGASESRDNSATFLARLVDNGWVSLAVTLSEEN